MLELISAYGTENDNQEYWDRLAQNYSEEQIVQGILVAFSTENADILQHTCLFVQHTTAHFPSVISQTEIVQKMEDIAACENLRNAQTAVFVLGRINSKRSVEKLRSILASGKHKDPDFIRNLEINIAMLSQ